MGAPIIRHIRTANNVSTYKISGDRISEATVVVFLWEEAKSVGAKCLTCDSHSCPHAERVLKRVKEGK
jgi:hypothetical protein